RRRRRGFIALLKLVELDRGVVLPHEKTLSGPKQDRLRLMRACHANFSQVFALYADPARQGEAVLEEAVRKLPPLYDFADEEGVAHRLWAVEDSQTIAALQELLRERPVYIADGHHRYETALLYRDERRRQEGTAAGPQPYDYVMMMFVNLDGEGLTIFPTHRLLKGLVGLKPGEFLARAEEHFQRHLLPFPEGEEGQEEAVAAFLQVLAREGEKVPALGVYAGGEEFHLLSLRGPQVLEAELPHLAPALRELDVTVLHALLLERILGVTEEEQREQKYITYTRDAVEAVRAVREGRYQLAFLLNPTRVEQVKAVAEAGETMPQKSTYFYPKLITGLVMNSLEGWGA
ncbi:MAG: DUF1015 domain-containing protein, partial [Bacillota bacterium]|nr:DUF1015 domain-containing protein [Bacillota bacterium]